MLHSHYLIHSLIECKISLKHSEFEYVYNRIVLVNKEEEFFMYVKIFVVCNNFYACKNY